MNQRAADAVILDQYPFCWRTGIERVRQVWRVALHPKFRPEVRLLAPFIEPGTGCLDIGANHGRFAFELARTGRRVLAFEPLRFNLAIIRPASALHRRVKVVPSALGEQSGTANLFVPLRVDRRPEHGSAFVAGDESEALSRAVGKKLVREPIEIRRLDDVDVSWVGRVGFIKMDVEGHEASVLRGGSRLLGEHRPAVLMECQTGSAGQEALVELEHLGYVLYDLDQREAGHWSDNAREVHAGIARASKSHDVLGWAKSRGQPPAFGASFDSTRFGR